MKGIFVRPKKPKQAIRKLKLEKLISDMNKPDEELTHEVTLLMQRGIIPEKTRDKYFNLINKYPLSIPYSLYRDLFCRKTSELG